MNNKLLLVIIVTYNGMKWLDKCLGSVVNSTVSADLFIVDNGSTDGSIEFIKKNYPKANLIISKENLGFGKANNLGLQYALDNNYDFVYLLNQDAWVEDDTFEKLINISQQNSEFGILSPLQTNKEKTRLDYNFSKCCGNDILSDYLCQQPVKYVYDVEFVMAAHWLISKNTILTLGGFSPTFPHYGEDTNYIARAHYHKLGIGIAPCTIGVHDRENRKITFEKKKYLNHIFSLCIASDINKKAINRIINILKTNIEFAISNRSFIPFFTLFKIVISLNKILRNNRLTKNGSAFLNHVFMPKQ